MRFPASMLPAATAPSAVAEACVPGVYEPLKA